MHMKVLGKYQINVICVILLHIHVEKIYIITNLFKM